MDSNVSNMDFASKTEEKQYIAKIIHTFFTADQLFLSQRSLINPLLGKLMKTAQFK